MLTTAKVYILYYTIKLYYISFTVSNNIGKYYLHNSFVSPQNDDHHQIATNDKDRIKLNYSFDNKNSKLNQIQEKINIFYLFSNCNKLNNINPSRMNNNKCIDFSSKSNQKLSWKYGQVNGLFCMKSKNRSLTYFHKPFKFDLLNNGIV